jgi:hypothetical protein
MALQSPSLTQVNLQSVRKEKEGARQNVNTSVEVQTRIGIRRQNVKSCYSGIPGIEKRRIHFVKTVKYLLKIPFFQVC